MNQSINIEPRRMAILIGAPGWGKFRLPGVGCDLKNFCDYLQTPRGGGWYPHEIITLDDPSRMDALEITGESIADYTLVYFSGHGYMENQCQNILSFRDGGLEDRLLLNDSPRQLVIADSCRKFLPGISGIPGETEEFAYATGFSEARELFNRYIHASRVGKLIVHATAKNQYAYDAASGRGGEFTLTLLNSLVNTNTHLNHAPITVENAIEQTRKNLKSNHKSQYPEITFQEGNFEVPLGIASTQFIRTEPANQRRLVTPTHPQKKLGGLSVGEGLLLAGFVGLLLLSASNNDR